MAFKWYLLKGSHTTLSGFEEINYEGFNEILDSELATDVELYNYDLTDRKEIKAVIQERMADTKLKTLNRHALVPIGTCCAGMYIKYDNRYWLITGIVDNNGIYEKAVMLICNYLLTWVNANNKIIQRWANVSSASQYNNGETTASHYYDRTDQLMVSMPDDDESMMLNTGDRFIVDRRCKTYEKNFANDVVIDTSNPVIVYRLTRSDSVLYDYQDSGYFQILIYQDEQRETDGYYVVDGKGYWICKPVRSETKNESKHIEISSACFEIYADGIPERFEAKFYDNSGVEVSETPTWEIVSDFSEDLNSVCDGSAILISTKDSQLVNKSFELFAKCDGYEDVSANILIKSFI